jgi:SAM-dependent methyltransferase
MPGMGNFIDGLTGQISANRRRKRAGLFRAAFGLTETTRILDLGSQNGAHIHSVLAGTPVRPENTYIADIDAAALERGREKYGFNPVLIGQSGKLPFPEGFFDIVYCSSVIEHVTVNKDQVWSLRSGKKFRELSLAHQHEFAREIQRIGRQFFVQTPYKYFVIEAHSWLPFVGWLPRELVVPILKGSRKVWPKKAVPDWHLLNRRQLASMFEGADIRNETWMGLTKSIMAVKSEQRPVAG